MNTFPIKDVFVSQFRIADISCTKSASWVRRLTWSKSESSK
jgi:hypothetical protein